MKRVILLNGPSSSGKSTLADSLQTLIYEQRKERYEIVSIDTYMRKVLTTDEPIYEDDVFEISADICTDAMNVLQTCDGVIIDHVITSERIDRQLAESLHTYRLYRVHVTCPLSILQEREKQRGDRFIGSAQASAEYLYPKDGYDITVDTHAMSADACALHIFCSVFGE